MLTVKMLRETLIPLSPQAAIDHWIRIFEKFAETPDFEYPRMSMVMKSGTQFSGYLIGGGGAAGSKDRSLIMSLVGKHDSNEARDILYANMNDVETITFFDVDHILQYLPRK